MKGGREGRRSFARRSETIGSVVILQAGKVARSMGIGGWGRDDGCRDRLWHGQRDCEERSLTVAGS